MDGSAVLSFLRGHHIVYVTASVRTEGSTADGNEVLDERSDRSLNLEVFAQKKAMLCRHDRRQTRIAHHMGPSDTLSMLRHIYKPTIYRQSAVAYCSALTLRPMQPHRKVRLPQVFHSFICIHMLISGQ